MCPLLVVSCQVEWVCVVFWVEIIHVNGCYTQRELDEHTLNVGVGVGWRTIWVGVSRVQ